MLIPSGCVPTSFQVAAAGSAIASAKLVVLNGSGTVGVEMAGDIKARHPNVEVVILSRSGSILNGDPFPATAISAVSNRLREIGVKVVKGSAPPSPEWLEYKLSPGKLTISDGDVTELNFDVYIPTFGQRPNTQFLDTTKTLNERKQIIANKYLQVKSLRCLRHILIYIIIRIIIIIYLHLLLLLRLIIIIIIIIIITTLSTHRCVVPEDNTTQTSNVYVFSIYSIF